VVVVNASAAQRRRDGSGGARAGGPGASRSDAIDKLPAASRPRAHRDDVRMVVVGRVGAPHLAPIAALPALLAPGDLLVVNDAATWPASLHAHTRAGEPIELRLAAGPTPGATVAAVLFGAGDWRTPTELRPPPPPVHAGDHLRIGELHLPVIAAVSDRIVELAIPADDAGFAALLAAGHPIQYAHVSRPLADWDVQTAYAGPPWAVEMPSAGRPLTWALLGALARRGVAIAPLTHAAGLSSTGDPELDATLPWPERYAIPDETIEALSRTAGRVVAVGTTVVRALETFAATGARRGVSELVLGGAHRPAIVDAVLSGLHDPTESHFRLLEAFAPATRLRSGWRLARARGLEGHELGDAMLVF
jgi:S-adenosylmethionine:tRNA ribosyltransferase-isomerase